MKNNFVKGLFVIVKIYRKFPDRSPPLLSVQFALTPGLYPGPGVYPGPGFYRNMQKALILGYRIVHMC